MEKSTAGLAVSKRVLLMEVAIMRGCMGKQPGRHKQGIIVPKAARVERDQEQGDELTIKVRPHLGDLNGRILKAVAED